MEKLFEAAKQGSTGSLHQLLQQDPSILDRALVNHSNETPLHVAAMLGHLEFVKEITRLKPQLAHELDLHNSSPLHLASANGHVEVMKALLSVEGGAKACLVRDRNTLTPVHLAAARGRVEAVKFLLAVQPEAALLSVNGEDSILHLCVKRFQLEALKILVEAVAESPDHEFINSKDAEGNTLLHLAVADKQVETAKYLVSVDGVDVDAVNKKGMTAMDVLIRSRRDDVIDSEIKKLIMSMGRNKTAADLSICNKDDENNNWDGHLKQHADWLEKQKDSLMIVATIIATMAFGVAVNPPGGVWQQDENPVGEPPRKAGGAILARNYSGVYDLFYIFNATAFMASLSIILLLVSGFPLRRRLFMWILIVFTWTAITCLVLCYVLAISFLTPDSMDEGERVWNVIIVVVIVWLILMALILFSHAIRFIVKLVKKLIKALGGEG